MAGRCRGGTRDWKKGFPGLKRNLVEWFAVRFEGYIDIVNPGMYKFHLISDDGSRLFINGEQVVDNDGYHSPRGKKGSIHLQAGLYPLVVEYFQGPRYRIALELRWTPPGAKKETVVPTEVLYMPSR